MRFVGEREVGRHSYSYLGISCLIRNTTLSFIPTLFTVCLLYLGGRLCRSFVFLREYGRNWTSATLSSNPTIHSMVALLASLAASIATTLFTVVAMWRGSRSWRPCVLFMVFLSYLPIRRCRPPLLLLGEVCYI